MIAKKRRIYIHVSSLGVTGTRNEITTDLEAIIKVVKEILIFHVPSGLEYLHQNRQNKMSKLADV